MSPVNHIDIKEFRDLGFLQEANRQFFHPHGLALEVTIVDEGGWKDTTDRRRVNELATALAKDANDEEHEEEYVPQAVRLLDLIHPPGSVHLSGVWDYRDDPEGVIFGGDIGHDDAKAKAVLAERLKHADVREALFGVWVKEQIEEKGSYLYVYPPDIEPLGYVHPETEETP